MDEVAPNMENYASRTVDAFKDMRRRFTENFVCKNASTGRVASQLIAEARTRNIDRAVLKATGRPPPDGWAAKTESTLGGASSVSAITLIGLSKTETYGCTGQPLSPRPSSIEKWVVTQLRHWTTKHNTKLLGIDLPDLISGLGPNPLELTNMAAMEQQFRDTNRSVGLPDMDRAEFRERPKEFAKTFRHHKKRIALDSSNPSIIPALGGASDGDEEWAMNKISELQVSETAYKLRTSLTIQESSWHGLRRGMGSHGWTRSVLAVPYPSVHNRNSGRSSAARSSIAGPAI